MSEWISVEDRLPERYREVLIWPQPENNGRKLIGEYGLIKGQDSPVWYYEIYTAGWGYEHEITNVTHWMPLPEPPCK